MKHTLLLLCFVFGLELEGQNRPPAENTRRTCTIAAIQRESPKIDGSLDDEAWKEAEVHSGFILLEPNPGGTPTRETEIRIMYDNEAIYLGAKLYDDPANILKELAPRDVYNNTDFIGVIFDPYGLGTSGFGFYVTPRNLQLDAQYISLEEDTKWDAIWASETLITGEGWQAEMRIPFSMLRFPNKDIQTWKVNFVRQMKKTREKGVYNPVNPEIPGMLNQMAQMTGLKSIDPPLRLSFFPYFATYYAPENKDAWNFSGGMDLKYGINDAYTLDVTLIPDFGQVSFDNTVYNLSPFEVALVERRPFFLEGLDLFSRANLFYSRRIGDDNNYFNQNELPAGKEILSTPSKNKLINAIKVSGRGRRGTAVGIFNAVERQTFATIKDTLSQVEEQLLVNPLSNYNIFVLDQALPNNSYVSLINTNVVRAGDFKDANVTGVDFDLRNKSQKFYFTGDGAVSFISNGSNQRNGYRYSLEGGKNGGKFVYFVNYNEIGRWFDPTDLGYQSIYNTRSAKLSFGYNTYNPFWILNRSQTWLNFLYERMILPDRFYNFIIETGTFLMEKEFNAVELYAHFEPIETYDHFEPRDADFDRFYAYPTNLKGRVLVSSDYRKMFALDGFYALRKWSEPGRLQHQINLKPRLRFNDYVSIFGSFDYNHTYRDVGFAFHARPGDEEFGWTSKDIIFAVRDVQTIEVGLEPSVYFNDKLNFALRWRNYWSQVSFHQFNLLGLDGHLVPNDFTKEAINFNTNTSAHYINFEARLTWRYRPGSDVILAWNAGDVIDSDKNDKYWNTYRRFNNHIKNNIVSIRVNWFLDWNNIFSQQ